MSSFLQLLDDIEAVRLDGYPKIALITALCLPDICGERMCQETHQELETANKYGQWIRENIKGVSGMPSAKEMEGEGHLINQNHWRQEMSRFAKNLYALRNCMVHGLNCCADGHWEIEFEYASDSIPPSFMVFCVKDNHGWHAGEREKYNAGLLIQILCWSARYYYEHGDDARKLWLDTFDDDVIPDNQKYRCQNNVIERQKMKDIQGTRSDLESDKR